MDTHGGDGPAGTCMDAPTPHQRQLVPCPPALQPIDADADAPQDESNMHVSKGAGPQTEGQKFGISTATSTFMTCA